MSNGTDGDTVNIVNEQTEMDEEHRKQLAVKKKDEGNQHFKCQEYEKAIELYTEAIDLDPDEPPFYTNRSIAYFKQEAYGYARMYQP